MGAGIAGSTELGTYLNAKVTNLSGVASTAEHSSRDAAIHAAHEVQNEMDALCVEIKQLLAACHSMSLEDTTVGGFGK